MERECASKLYNLLTFFKIVNNVSKSELLIYYKEFLPLIYVGESGVVAIT